MKNIFNQGWTRMNTDAFTLSPSGGEGGVRGRHGDVEAPLSVSICIHPWLNILARYES
jgi:hypothetical protein